MAIDTAIIAGRFQQSIQAFKQGMLHLDLSAAISTDDVMVVAARDLVG